MPTCVDEEGASGIQPESSVLGASLVKFELVSHVPLSGILLSLFNSLESLSFFLELDTEFFELPLTEFFALLLLLCAMGLFGYSALTAALRLSHMYRLLGSRSDLSVRSVFSDFSVFSLRSVRSVRSLSTVLALRVLNA